MVEYIANYDPFQHHLEGNIGFYGDVKVWLLLALEYNDFNFDIVLLDKLYSKGSVPSENFNDTV